MAEKEEKPETPKEEKAEVKEGYKVKEVVQSTTRVLTYNGEQIDADVLLVKMANHLKDQTGFKFD